MAHKNDLSSAGRLQGEYPVNTEVGLEHGDGPHLLLATSARGVRGPSPLRPPDYARLSRPGANRLRGACKHLSDRDGAALAVLILPRSGHETAVTRIGVKQQRAAEEPAHHSHAPQRYLCRSAMLHAAWPALHPAMS
jgi:hypothetical protein